MITKRDFILRGSCYCEKYISSDILVHHTNSHGCCKTENWMERSPFYRYVQLKTNLCDLYSLSSPTKIIYTVKRYVNTEQLLNTDI